jgi:hypothetical protein
VLGLFDLLSNRFLSSASDAWGKILLEVWFYKIFNRQWTTDDHPRCMKIGDCPPDFFLSTGKLDFRPTRLFIQNSPANINREAKPLPDIEENRFAEHLPMKRQVIYLG